MQKCVCVGLEEKCQNIDTKMVVHVCVCVFVCVYV